MAIATKYQIPVIEDAAEALGSSYYGKALGTFGEIGIFSFNGNKIITTSGGGALVSKNAEYTSKAIFLATQARDKAPHYQHSEIGFNYRMNNVAAGIGVGQLETIADRVQSRRANHDFYLSQLSGESAIHFLDEPANFHSNRWLTTVLTDSFATREAIRTTLEEERIECKPLWKPLHLQPIFQKYPSYLNGNSENFFNKGLCLPSGSNLSRTELEEVVKTILKAL